VSLISLRLQNHCAHTFSRFVRTDSEAASLLRRTSNEAYPWPLRSYPGMPLVITLPVMQALRVPCCVSRTLFPKF